MFDKIDKNIKDFAQVLCWVGVIASIILAIVMFAKAGDSYYTEGLFTSLGFIFLIVGPIISIINGMLVYGFGELIEKVMSIDTKLKKNKGNRVYNPNSTVKFDCYHGAIEWLVLDKKDDKALLISKYCLDANAYDKNEENESVTWETSTLRQWLNGEFINEAFTEKEKTLICDTHLKNPNNPKYGTDGGNDTTDKVFLLSIDEVEKYFANGEKRKAEATGYAKYKGICVSEENGNVWWWLRSPGSNSRDAVYVDLDGSVRYYGSHMDDEEGGVRPAMWVKIEEWGEKNSGVSRHNIVCNS